MFFSIVIPVYNVEKYIDKCVESILKQNYNDYEIILVDDGSIDSSGKICEKYKKLYPQKIKVIHKKNGGLSSARNVGIKYAEGEYIVFIDSDDYIEDNSLCKINKEINFVRPDVIALYGYKFENEGNISEGLKFRDDLDIIVSGKEFYKKALYQDLLSVGAPYYIYKKQFIIKNNLSFTEGLYHEDELWTPIMLYYADTVFDLKYRYYYYRSNNQNSITRNKDTIKKRAEDREKISLILSDFFALKKDKGVAPFDDNISAQYMYALYCNPEISKLNINRVFPLKHAKTMKYKIKSFIFLISPKLAFCLRKMKDR